jgi:hypothetical protein
MAEYIAKIRAAASVLVGAVLYSLLNWIPLIGPFAAGVLVGYLVGGGFNRGLRHAAVSAALGAAAIAYALVFYDPLSLRTVPAVTLLFISWILLVWNTAGIAVASIGGGFGAVGKDLHSFLPRLVEQLTPKTRPNRGIDYLFCPVCGQGNAS